jgi:cytochrome c-type biogenesis protein CcmH
MSGDAKVWLFAAIAIVIVAAFGVSLYWGGKRDVSRKQSLWLVVIVPLVVAGLYALRGNPQALNPPPSPMQQMQTMFARVPALAERLKQHPEDLDGWILLARSYTMMGRYAEAEDAYEHGQQRVMQDTDLLLSWIEIRLMLGNRKFDARTNELLDHAVQLAPDDTNVMLLRALSAYDRGDNAAADALVDKLHERFPANNPDRQALDEALAKWRASGGESAPDTTGTTALPADHPATNSDGAPDPKVMVQRLADRMKQHPEDMDGWLQLARSYAVLGRYADANDAYEHAQARAMQDADALTIWIEMRWRMNNQKFDARTQELLDHAVKLAPDDTNVLLLRALSAYEHGDKANATALIEKLRASHPVGSPERQSLDAAIADWMPDNAQAKP